MATTSGEVIVPSQTASVQITPIGTNSQVWLTATGTGATVFVGPSGVTPQTGFPLPPGQVIGPLSGAAVIHGVCGENQGRGVAVRFLQITP